jgi:hypothetical protein
MFWRGLDRLLWAICGPCRRQIVRRNICGEQWLEQVFDISVRWVVKCAVALTALTRIGLWPTTIGKKGRHVGSVR